MRASIALSWWLVSSAVAAVQAATNSVKPTRSCFTLGQSITVSFTDANPQVGDWIGLIDSSANVFGSVNYPNFVFTCGTATCSGAPASGTVSIFNAFSAGSYKAVLLPANSFTPIVVGANFGVHSSCSPTAPVRPPPTAPVRRPPTRRPTAPQPTPTGGINIPAAQQALQQASNQIQALVRQDGTLLPQFLRLLFHDCHGICDGCVDLSNPDNFRLDIPIDTLAPIVSQFANSNTGLSRSDLWVQAMVTALNMANQKSNNPVTFSMNWIGRKDCEKVSSTCINISGQRVACSAKTGGHQAIASVNLNTDGFANFWKNKFNMSVRQGIALIGCHTVGVLHKEVSGIDGPNGWLIDNVSFTNEYYQALLGSRATPNSNTQQLLSVAPGWTQTFEDNSDTSPRIPDRNFWTLVAGTPARRIVMTDADVSICRQMDSSNQDSNGRVSCSFSGNKNTCPFSGNIGIVQEFLDNDTWLAAVRDALDFMTTNGYNRPQCNGQLCVLG